MLRKILKLEKNELTIELPVDMIGKMVEIIAFEIEEKASKVSPKRRPSELRGFLSNKSADALQKRIKRDRDEWDIL
jgi:hypothetical protein